MKQKTVFLCSDCGYESPKWYGKCPSCGAWNTMSEFKPAARVRRARHDELRARRIAADPGSATSRPATRRVFFPASGSLTAFSAAARCTARSCWLAVSPASANPRSCSRCVRRCAGTPACCMFPARSRSGRSSSARPVCTSPPPSCISSRRPTWIRSSTRPSSWRPTFSSWTRSRRSTSAI